MSLNSRAKTPLILASQSPRRRALLENAGIDIVVIPSHIDESQAAPDMSPEAYARRLAVLKARHVGRAHPDRWVIGADTIVVIDGDILGKPGSAGDATAMLTRLSGATHQVVTGYAIIHNASGRLHADSVVTDVEFKLLSEAEIRWYIHTGEPFDKAGAYAIQGIGTFLVRRIAGSYTNVVGLPVCEVIEYLIANRVIDYDHVPSGGGKCIHETGTDRR